jgi:lipid-binding SYLF domain-containing protein
MMMKKTISKTTVGLLLASLAASVLGASCASTKGNTPDEKRSYALKMRDDTLSELYRQKPEAKEKVEKAAGYGTFSNIGTNIIFVSTGGGFGVITDNATGEKTYMKMGEFGVGLGLGLKDFRAVFVFRDKAVMNNWIYSGWEWGGEADAAAKSGDQGGAATAAGNVNEGVEVYQFTASGIALSATVSGTKYWRDDELNAPR